MTTATTPLTEQKHEVSPNPGVIFDMLMAYQRTAALRAAVELDLFRAVGEGLRDAKSIAERLNASFRGTRILCDFLVVNGLLSGQNGSYTLAPTAAAFLDSRSPYCLGSITRFLGDPIMAQPFNNLADIVRQGRTTLPGQGSVEPDNPVWVEFAESMAPMMAPMAPFLAGIALEDRGTSPRVLDIAAGHGLFGIAAASHCPGARIVAQDWAAVLEVAKRNAAKAGVIDRYETLPGSAFDVDFGGPYDIVLVTNFLHHFDTDTCIGLLKKIRSAMNPGARVATLDFVPNDDRVSPPTPAAFAMTMLGTTAAGDVYTFRELEAMYKEAGFADAAIHSIPTGPDSVVTGRAV